MKRAQVPMTNHYNNNGARGVLKNVGNVPHNAPHNVPHNVPHKVGFGNGGAANFNGNDTNGFATPSEDEFDDFDDDNFLLAASQQVERQMTDNAHLYKDTSVDNTKQELIDKQGEIKILRDRIDNLSREKRDAELKHQQQVNNTDKKNKKELETLSSKLVFRDREMAELQAQLIAAKKSTPSVDVVSIAKRPRLHALNANDKKEDDLNQHRLRGFRNKRSNILTNNLNKTSESPKEKAMLLIQSGLQQSNNVRSMFGLSNYKSLPQCTKQYTDPTLPIKVAHCLIATLQCKDKTSEQASTLLIDLACSRHVQSVIFSKLLELLCDEGAEDTVSKLLASMDALDVWNRCNRSENCPLVALYRRPNKLIMRHLYHTIDSVQAINSCSCTNKLVKFVSETVVQCVEEEDSVSYREGLAVLGAMLPHFTQLELPSTTQALFHQALHIVKIHDSSLTDEIDTIMNTAQFDQNMSMGE